MLGELTIWYKNPRISTGECYLFFLLYGIYYLHLKQRLLGKKGFLVMTPSPKPQVRPYLCQVLPRLGLTYARPSIGQAIPRLGQVRPYLGQALHFWGIKTYQTPKQFVLLKHTMYSTIHSGCNNFKLQSSFLVRIWCSIIAAIIQKVQNCTHCIQFIFYFQSLAPLQLISKCILYLHVLCYFCLSFLVCQSSFFVSRCLLSVTVISDIFQRF